MRRPWAALWFHANLTHADPEEYDEALRYSTAAAALRPDNPRVLGWLGQVLLYRGRQDEALAVLRRALELAPEMARTHYRLGAALRVKGQFAEAISTMRKAIALQPEAGYAHNGLGLMLYLEERQFDEAIVEFRRAITLTLDIDDPIDKVISVTNLGGALWEKGRLHEATACFQTALTTNRESARIAALGLLIGTGQTSTAIALCRKAIATHPKDPLARLGLAWALEAEGQFEEALPAFKSTQELGVKRPSLAIGALPRFVRDCERMIAIEGQWPAYAEGKLKPRDRNERRLLTLHCAIHKRYLTAARLHADGLTDDPAWADDLAAEARYDAARYAALVAAVQGKDTAKLDPNERGRWRKQAVDWLRDELARQMKHLESAAPLDRRIALDRLRWWQQEPDLAAIRDPAAVAKLPADQQVACKQVWADVEALLKKAQGMTNQPSASARGNEHH